MKKERIRELIEVINKASHAYYNEDKEIMSNFEYDALYDELVALEKETGVIYPDSPTQNVAVFDKQTQLTKVEHEYPALSLDKTKDRESLVGWLNGKKGVLSWKLDGLTIVATYVGGKLVQALTRGNGYIGEDVTHNAKYFIGLPNEIAYKGKLIVRGEALMTYKEFRRINALIDDVEAEYSNPRNLASATVRMLDPTEAASRQINVPIFDIVFIEYDGTIGDEMNFKSYQFEWLKSQGFATVEHTVVSPDTVVEAISSFEKKLKENEFPSDGLVLIFDDEKYGISLGSTKKFPRNGIAFKWADETKETTIRAIEWSASRTGLLNPVAIFDPIELEGTTVSRASIHNVSIAESLLLGIGSRIEVFKANMIIPQIAKTVLSAGPTVIPSACPVCGGATEIRENDGIKTLYCNNKDCVAKNIGRWTHFVDRDCMNILGLSESTLAKFINCGYIHTFGDLYRLDEYKDDIIGMEGFGEKSWNKIWGAINKSKNVKFSAFLNAIGIAGIGKDMAKQISVFFGENALEKFICMFENGKSFADIEGVGDIINENMYSWYGNAVLNAEFRDVICELNIVDDEIKTTTTSAITGKVFVITGSVVHFKNREALKEYIESLGGKVAGSVSVKTDYLINNDIASTSGKNKKAKELGVAIINEETFLEIIKA